MAERFLFTTEGHVIPINPALQNAKWKDDATWWKLPLPQTNLPPTTGDVHNLPPLPSLGTLPVNHTLHEVSTC